MNAVRGLARIVRVCAAPAVTARFYEQALGFTIAGAGAIDEPALGELLGLTGARADAVTVCLGEDRVDLVRIEPGGRAYPPDVPGNSALFQHFAIEVSDMDVALTRLGTTAAWSGISIGGPQVLPPASGGVTAFKFRDPEGHPLELISAARPVRGTAARIAHSALSVEAAARSISFYQRLGLVRTGGSLNVGVEQERLDGVRNACVDVTALSVPEASGPHLELLCYTNRFRRPPVAPQPNDIAADWLVFTVRDAADLQELLTGFGRALPPARFADGSLRSLVQDPDGHWLCLEVPAG